MKKIIIILFWGLICFIVETKANNWNAIIPGTKWCGDGSIAKNYDDLGMFKEVDSCCRAHDHCSDIIPVGKSKYGLKNTGSFTRLNCECEAEFNKCLKAAKDSFKIIILKYFTDLNQKCFAYRHPAICSDYYNKFEDKCYRYKYNMDLPKKWQWFDVLIFT